MVPFAHIPWIEVHAVDHCNNVCRHCNQRSPFAPRRDYAAEDYLPWLHRLDALGVAFDQINVTGGEPFLHPDLEGFARAMRTRFPAKALVLISNAFWLSERACAVHAGLFGTVDALVVSLYPNIVHAHGGRDSMLAKLGRLKELHPALEVVTVGRTDFYPISFEPRPENPTAPSSAPCRWADCTGLTPDGRLTRCSVAAHAHLGNPALPGPLADPDLYFDLRGDLAGLDAWRAHWPLAACARCTARTAPALPWKAGAARRRLDYEAEYLARLERGAA